MSDRVSRRTVLTGAASLMLPRPALAKTMLASRVFAEAGQLFAPTGHVFDTDVVIVGAGAAGLAAAAELQTLAMAFVLVEARPRIGGRVFTDTSLGVPYDAGALYIHWSETNPWTDIAKRCGFETRDDRGESGPFQLYDKGVRLAESERRRRRQAFDILSRDVDADPASVPDVSLVQRTMDDGPAVVEAAGSMARMALGEEPERVSALDYARLWSGDDLLVPAGYGALVARFGEGLPVTLGTTVEAIRWDGPGVTVETAQGAIRARAAVVTVSAGVLAAGTIRFTPDLPSLTRAGIEGLGMGALTKIALRFDGSRFGIPAGVDLFESDGPKRMFDFECWPFDHDIVITYVGGDHARDIARRGEREAIAIAVEAFDTVVGGEAKKALVSGRLNAWSEDPYSRGSYSHALPGQAEARGRLAAPVAERLYFAGEATGGADFGGAMTAGGAYLAGRDAARAIAKRKG